MSCSGRLNRLQARVTQSKSAMRPVLLVMGIKIKRNVLLYIIAFQWFVVFVMASIGPWFLQGRGASHS